MLRRIAFGLMVAVASLTTEATVAQTCATCPGTTRDVRITRVGLGGGTETALACMDAGTNFTINLEDYSDWDQNSGDWVLHIYSCGGNSIGKVTIAGNPLVNGSPAINSLSVLVAGVAQSWQGGEDDPLDTGCSDFGGLEVSNSTTLAKTRASVAVSGSITAVTSPSPPDPDILVNQVIRIQAESGRIDGAITAEGSGLSSSDSIGQVRARDSINGTIEAVSGNISAVRILGTASGSAGGIQADILCDAGSIDTIWTTRPIGSSGTSAKIWAASGINEVRAHNEAGGVSYVAAPFFLDLQGGRSPTNNGSQFDDVCTLIESGGDIEGSIDVPNLGPPSAATGGHYGVYAKGRLRADIHVRHVCAANIVGQTIEGDVVIGCTLEGGVVAWDVDNSASYNVIPLLSIGREEADGYDDNYTRGCVGADDGSDTSMTGCGWFDVRDAAVHGDGTTFGTLYVFEGCDEGNSGLIAARRIASLEVENMTAREQDGSGGEWHNHQPIIECQYIDSIDVTFLREGSIWSGLFDSGSYPSDTDGTDDYVKTGTVHIGCIGAGGKVFAQDFSAFEVTGAMNGEIHVPTVGSTATLIVGDALGAYSASGSYQCKCDTAGQTCTDTDWPVADFGSATSPRTPLAAAAGLIFIDGAAQLAGQIILNGNNDGDGASTLWKGDVTMATNTSSSQVTFTYGASQPNSAPFYERTESDMGGGAIGLHGTDCNPLNNAQVCDESVPTRTWPAVGEGIRRSGRPSS